VGSALKRRDPASRTINEESDKKLNCQSFGYLQFLEMLQIPVTFRENEIAELGEILQPIKQQISRNPNRWTEHFIPYFFHFCY
jgi:hypothetical protein